MKIKLRDKIILYTFFALLLLPSIIWWFISPNLPMENIDNRQLKTLPILNSLTMKQFPEEFDKYYADNLPFRSYAISCYQHILYVFTKNVESEKMVFGKNDWIFYKSQQNEDPIIDYKRINQFEPEELVKIAKNLTDLKEYCKKRNCEFYFFIAPNKENIYTEYMPDSIIRAGYISRTKQLINYLKNNTDIKVIDATDELLRAKKEDFVYYKNDTHWNRLGGYIGSKLLLESLGLELPEITDLQKVYYLKVDEAGRPSYDLANLSGIQDFLYETNEIGVTGYSNSGVVEKPAIFEGEIVMYCKDAPKKEKIMMIRDSFAGYMIPVVSHYYKDSVYIHYNSFKKEMLNIEKPNLLVFEIVERALSNLMDYDFEEKN